MTDWGAHHFGGATFTCDVRDLQPNEVSYFDDKDGKYLAFRYPNGLTIYHNRPKAQNLEIEGTPGETLPPKPVPGYKGDGGIYGDFIHCVKTREKPFRDIESAVNSLTAQDYQGAFEIVLALGPSVDGTNDVLEEMASADPRIRRIPNELGSTPGGLTLTLPARADGEIDQIVVLEFAREQ